MIQRLMLAILFTLALVASVVVGYWFQSRDLPVRSRIVEIVGPAYPGGKLLVRWNVFRERACYSTKQEFVLDVRGVRWIIPEQIFKVPPGAMGADEFVSQTDLPEDLPVGPAVLRVSLAYVCNPIHKFWPVINRIPDQPITISPKPVANLMLN